MGIYTVGSIAWGVAVAFYAAVFPNLARNRGRIRELKERRDQGKITTNEYIQAEALEKSRISSFSIVRALTSRSLRVMTGFLQGHGAIGYVIILLFELPMLFTLQGNSKVNNYVIMM
jgi:Vacuole effluxer Atg22 like